MNLSLLKLSAKQLNYQKNNIKNKNSFAVSIARTL